MQKLFESSTPEERAVAEMHDVLRAAKMVGKAGPDMSQMWFVFEHADWWFEARLNKKWRWDLKVSFAREQLRNEAVVEHDVGAIDVPKVVERLVRLAKEQDDYEAGSDRY